MELLGFVFGGMALLFNFCQFGIEFGYHELAQGLAVAAGP